MTDSKFISIQLVTIITSNAILRSYFFHPVGKNGEAKVVGTDINHKNVFVRISFSF